MTVQDVNPPTIIRRREKRRHVAPNAVDLRDPLNLINIAVRIDEVSSIHNGTSLVSVPLESGRLYNQLEFQTALKYLRKSTSTPKIGEHKLVATRMSSPIVWLLAYFLDWLHPTPKQIYPNVAITPVILSGLLAAQSSREKEETESGQNRDEEAMPTTTELLMHCITMRRAAVARLEWRKKRQKLQNRIVITLLLFTSYAIYRQIMSNLRDSMIELGYLGSYEGMETGDDSGLRGEIAKLSETSFIYPCARMSLNKEEVVQLETELKDELRNKRKVSILKSIDDLKQRRPDYDFSSSLHAVKISHIARTESSHIPSKRETKDDHSIQGYESACFAAETRLWSHLGSYALSKNSDVRVCDGDGCVQDFKYYIKKMLSRIGRLDDLQIGHAPYAIHTPMMRHRLVAPGDHMYVLQPARQETFDECNVVNDDIRWLGSSSVNALVATVLKRRFDRLSISDRPKVLDIGCGVGGTLYALAHPMGLFEENVPETCWTQKEIPFKKFFYEGITISAAEVVHARKLAMEHGMNPSRFRFSQLNFDDPSLRGRGYSAAFAIESLSFSQNITKTLQGLSEALDPGGSFILVDDIVTDPARFDIDEQKQSNLLDVYSQVSRRQTLITQKQWINELQGSNFRVDKVIDLGLRFDFPMLINARTKTSTLMRMLLNKHFWQSEHVSSLLNVWEWWLRKPRMRILSKIFGEVDDFSQSYATIRTLQMFRGFAKLIAAQRIRRAAHSEGYLTYNMFICTKIK